MIKEKVSANQFFLLLYLSLLSTVFMYLSSSHIKIAQTDTLLRPLIFVVVSLVVSVPTFFVLKKHTQLKANRQFIPETKFLKCVACVYAVVYFFSILKTVARFDLFASSELFPNSDMTVFLVLLIVACAVLSFLGLGALSRAAGIFTFLVCASTVFVMLSLSNEVDLLNFTPVFKNGFNNFLKDGLIFAVQATEIGTIIMFLPDIKGDTKKTYIRWIILSALSFSVIFFFVIGSLGAFADTQLFPTYTAVSLASFGLIERIDALETAIWILCIVEKIAFYFLICIKALRYAFKGVSKRITAILTIFSVSAVITLVSYNIEKFGFLSEDLLTVVLFLLSAVILPAVVYFYIRRVKPSDKIQESI